MGRGTGTRAPWSLLALGLAVAAVCLGFVHATRSDAYWTTDCASRALVAERLLETGYRDPNFDYPAAAVDPQQRAFPLAEFALPRAGGRVSVFPVAYPALTTPFLALLGPPGLRWPAALGTGACAALFALWLLPGFGRRTALCAGVAFGLATPLFFYGVTVWEHSLTVAGVLLATVLLQREGWRPALTAGVVMGLASWLREELALFGFALVIVDHLRMRDPRRTLALVAGGGVCGLALAGFNAAVYGSVLGSHVAALDPARALAQQGIPELGWRASALLVGWAGGNRTAVALAALALALLGLGAWLEWRRPGSTPALLVAAAVGLACSGLALVRIVQGPPLPGLVAHNGLLSQIPFASLAGIGVVRLVRSPACAALRPGIAAGLAFLLVAGALGLATQSVFGMGPQIGPRKLLPALPALAALAIVALFAGPDPRSRSRVAAGVAVLLGVAGLLASATAGTLLLHQKSEAASLQDRIRARPEPFLVSGDAPLTQGLLGLWHDTPLLYTPTRGSLASIVTAMRARGVRSFLVLSSPATPLDDPALRVRCRPLPPYRGGVVGYWDTDLFSCALR